MTGGTTTILLTDAERASWIDEVFGHRFNKHGELYLPTTALYNSLDTDQGINNLAVEMFRYIGIRPRTFNVAFGQQKDAYTVSEHTITVNAGYMGHPHVIGGIIALAVISYAVQQYGKHDADNALIEYASVQSGLGLWVLNATGHKTSEFEAIFHAIDGRWHKAESLRLTSYSYQKYIELVTAYAHNHRISPNEYVPHITTAAAKLLPEIVRYNVHRSLPLSNAQIHHARQTKI